MKWRAALAFVLVGLLWGSAWIPNSVVLRDMPGIRAGSLRFAIAAVFAAIPALVSRLRVRGASRRAAAIFADSLILGATAVAMPYALTVWAAGRVSPGGVAVLFALMPLAAVLLSRERMSAAIPALVIGVGGVTFLVAQGMSISAAQIKCAALIACAVLLGAFSLNYAKNRLLGADILISVAIQFAFAAVLLGALSGVTERGQSAAWGRDAYLSLLALGVLVSGVTLPLMYWLLTKLESWQVATLQWSATLIAVAEAAWFLRVRPSADMWAGAALIVGATVWLLRGSRSAPEAVTLEITNHTNDGSGASESEVGSK
jgi:drug/metabolite transporter (DMT)-like permease